jgi:hypothetical protein
MDRSGKRHRRISALHRQDDVLFALMHVGHQPVLTKRWRRHGGYAPAGLLVDAEEMRPVVAWAFV